MKYLAGVLALAALCAAEPEADPLYSVYAPYLLPYARPYYASGYAGPLPGASYQAVHRLHRREAEADPQLLLNAPFAAAPYAAVAPLSSPVVYNTAPVAPVFSTANAVFNAPLVKSVVEAPAVVSHTVHTAPIVAPAAYAAAPLGYAAHPFGYAAAAPLVAAPATVAVGLNAHDCVTEGGCALRAALATGLPAATVGSTSVVGRKRREAEAEADAEAEAEADPFYNNFYGYGAFPYSGFGYNAYNALPYSAPYTLPYAYNYAPYNYAPYVAAPAPVVEAAPAPVVEAAPTPVVEAVPALLSGPPVRPPVYNYAPVAAPAPVVYNAAPVVAAPVVETTHKQVTYTHLGAHPITPTTVLQSESRLVGR